MSSVRFLISNANDVAQTQWYDEIPPGNGQAGTAAQLINKLRLSNPDALIYTQHDEREAKELNVQQKPDEKS